ncbi:hypothetical protein STEG23_032904, partial [Scotinomys teguina]
DDGVLNIQFTHQKEAVGRLCSQGTENIWSRTSDFDASSIEPQLEGSYGFPTIFAFILCNCENALQQISNRVTFGSVSSIISIQALHLALKEGQDPSLMGYACQLPAAGDGAAMNTMNFDVIKGKPVRIMWSQRTAAAKHRLLQVTSTATPQTQNRGAYSAPNQISRDRVPWERQVPELIRP